MKNLPKFIAIPLAVITTCLGFVGCSATQIANFQTTADNIGSNLKTYAQSLANMLVTGSKTLVTLAPAIQTLAQQWGLLPANSDQLATYNKIVTAIGLVGNDVSAAQSLLTSIQTTGTVPTVTSSGTTTSMNWSTPSGLRMFTKDKATGEVTDVTIVTPEVASN